MLPHPNNKYNHIDTITKIINKNQIPNKINTITIQNLHHSRTKQTKSNPNNTLIIKINKLPNSTYKNNQLHKLKNKYHTIIKKILNIHNNNNHITTFLHSISKPKTLTNTSKYNPNLNLTNKQHLLKTINITKQLKLALELQHTQLTKLQIHKHIHNNIKKNTNTQQHKYFLHKQIKSIHKKLNKNNTSIINKFQTKINKSTIPNTIHKQTQQKLNRLKQINKTNNKSSIIQTYLN